MHLSPSPHHPHQSLSQLFFAEHLLLYQSIDLSRNSLSVLGPNVRCLVSVTELHLDSNQLQQLPPEMATLKQLKLLSLKDNRILILGRFLGTLQ